MLDIEDLFAPLIGGIIVCLILLAAAVVLNFYSAVINSGIFSTDFWEIGLALMALAGGALTALIKYIQ